MAASPQFPWRALAAGLGLLVLFGSLVRRYGLAVKAMLRRRADRAAASEPFAFARLRQACRHGNAKAVANLLPEWLKRLYGQSRPVSMVQFFEDADDPALAEQMKRVNEGLYSSRSSSDTLPNRWDPRNMQEALVRARRTVRRSGRHHAVAPARLSPLNPAGQLES